MEQTFNTPYSELMREMLDEFIEKRNVIIVLGYKYEDEHINEIFMKALANPNNVFFFFDYDCNENNNFINKVIKISENLTNINIIRGKNYASFVNFSDYIFPSTPSKTDEETIIDILKKVLIHE